MLCSWLRNGRYSLGSCEETTLTLKVPSLVKPNDFLHIYMPMVMRGSTLQVFNHCRLQLKNSFCLQNWAKLWFSLCLSGFQNVLIYQGSEHLIKGKNFLIPVVACNVIFWFIFCELSATMISGWECICTQTIFLVMWKRHISVVHCTNIQREKFNK